MKVVYNNLKNKKKIFLKSKVKKPISIWGRREQQGWDKNYFENKNIKDLSTNYLRRGKYDKNILLHIIKYNLLKLYQIAQSNYHIIIEPRLYGKDKRYSKICRNTHSLIRKYGLDIVEGGSDKDML